MYFTLGLHWPFIFLLKAPMKKESQISRDIYIYGAVMLLCILPLLLLEKGDVVLQVNGSHSPFQDWFFRLVTLAGDGIIFVPLILLALLVSFRHAITLTTIGVVHCLIIAVLKRVIFSEALRPKNVLPHELLHFVSGVNVHGHMSFPSGHTTTAFAVAFYILLVSDKKIWGHISLLLAALIAYSRIYLLQHFYVDVFFGALTGITTAYVCWKAQEYIKLPTWVDLRLIIQIGKSKKVSSKPTGTEVQIS